MGASIPKTQTLSRRLLDQFRFWAPSQAEWTGRQSGYSHRLEEQRVGKERLAGWPRPPPDICPRKPVFLSWPGMGICVYLMGSVKHVGQAYWRSRKIAGWGSLSESEVEE